MIPTIDTSRIGAWVISLLVSVTVIAIIFAFIPPVALPGEITGAIQWLVQTLVDFSFIFPIATIFQVLALVFLVEIILLTIRLVLWLNHMFNRNAS